MIVVSAHAHPALSMWNCAGYPPPHSFMEQMPPLDTTASSEDNQSALGLFPHVPSSDTCHVLGQWLAQNDNGPNKELLWSLYH